MADELNKKITVDIEINTDGQQQIDQYKVAFNNLQNSINGLSGPLDKLSRNISSIDKGLTTLSGSANKLDSENNGLTSSAKEVGESFVKTSEITEMFSKVLKYLNLDAKALAAELTVGLSVLISFAPELIEWATALFKGKEAVDKTKLSVSAMNSAVDSTDYSNAVKQVNDLTANIGLAKKGYLDKKQVLAQYNDTLGKTMGKVSDLDQAEAKIVKNGKAYVQMALLKASAEAASQNAAKKAVEAEEARLKSDDDELTSWDKFITFFHSAEVTAQKKADKAKERRKEEVDDLTKQSDASLSIMEKFETQAAELAKKAHLNFSGNEVAEKTGTGEAKQKRQEALGQMEKMQKDSLGRQLQATYEAYGKEALAENDHYQEEAANGQDIEVHISSVGGSAFDAIAIYDLLKKYTGIVTTYVDALAASAASIVAMGGKTVVMSKYALLMIHKPMVGTGGNADELLKDVQMLNTVQARLAQIYMDKTGLDSLTINSLINAVTWLSADQALDLGFIDQIENYSADITNSAIIKNYMTNAPTPYQRNINKILTKNSNMNNQNKELIEKTTSVLDKIMNYFKKVVNKQTITDRGALHHAGELAEGTEVYQDENMDTPAANDTYTTSGGSKVTVASGKVRQVTPPTSGSGPDADDDDDGAPADKLKGLKKPLDIQNKLSLVKAKLHAQNALLTEAKAALEAANLSLNKTREEVKNEIRSDFTPEGSKRSNKAKTEAAPFFAPQTTLAQNAVKKAVAR